MKLKMCTGCGEPILMKEGQKSFSCHECGKTSKEEKARTIDSGNKDYLLKRRSEIKRDEVENKKNDLSVDYNIGDRSSGKDASSVCSRLLEIFEPIKESELVEKAENNGVPQSEVEEFLKEKEERGEIYYSNKGIKTI